MNLSEKKKYITALIVVIGASIIFGVTLYTSLFRSDNSVSLVSEESNEVLFVPVLGTTTPQLSVDDENVFGPSELPQRLIIPSLSVDAAIQEVGITKSGAMGIPTNFSDVGWYKFGTVPGQRGSAVIAGHKDNGLALPAIFNELHTLEENDSLYVKTESGSTIHFTIESIETYEYTALPLKRIYSDADTARLVLITCIGEWIKVERTYDKRLVVYARIASQD